MIFFLRIIVWAGAPVISYILTRLLVGVGVGDMYRGITCEIMIDGMTYFIRLTDIKQDSTFISNKISEPRYFSELAEPKYRFEWEMVACNCVTISISYT